MLVKIFSYNIHGLPFLPDSWTEPLYEWFNGCDHDFVCIQEAFTPARIEGITKSLEANGYTVLKPNDFAIRKNLMGSGLVTAVHSKRWTVRDEGFTAYDQCAGAEHLTNKGFHWLTLKSRKDGSDLIIVNTHMQADHPFNYFAGCMDTRPIRKHQMEQILAFLKGAPPHRSLLIGDLNSEEESHENIKYLTGLNAGFRKHTFEPTGEDLDHVAIVPEIWQHYLQPLVREISVLSRLWWSDHWPLHVTLEFNTDSKQL
jgi:endonuclease/exonuclease/phosphatase family metal-dependent hydrolase